MEDVEATPRRENTNLDDELRHRLIEGNALPDPETTASMGGAQRCGARTLRGGVRSLRTHHAFWESLQRSLVHELQVSLNGDPSVDGYVEDPDPSKETARASERLVDEITIHCDIPGRLMQSFSGEAIAHGERVREHLARVRQRTEVGLWNATVTSRGSTTSSTAMAPPEK